MNVCVCEILIIFRNFKNNTFVVESEKIENITSKFKKYILHFILCWIEMIFTRILTSTELIRRYKQGACFSLLYTCVFRGNKSRVLFPSRTGREKHPPGCVSEESHVGGWWYILERCRLTRLRLFRTLKIVIPTVSLRLFIL